MPFARFRPQAGIRLPDNKRGRPAGGAASDQLGGDPFQYIEALRNWDQAADQLNGAMLDNADPALVLRIQTAGAPMRGSEREWVCGSIFATAARGRISNPVTVADTARRLGLTPPPGLRKLVATTLVDLRTDAPPIVMVDALAEICRDSALRQQVQHAAFAVAKGSWTGELADLEALIRAHMSPLLTALSGAGKAVAA